MAEDVMSDVDLLLGCFERGVSQRSSRKQRSGDGKQRTPSKCGNSRNVDDSVRTAPAEECERTPEGKENRIGGRSEHSSVSAVKKSASACKQISPGVFYGSPLGKPAITPPQFQRLLNDIRRDLAGQNQFREVESAGEFTQATATRTAIWATFPRQEQAIQFAESDANNKLVVFQYQDHINGQRRFLATTYEEFWYRYKRMIADYRHHYEIIQDGKPCHLYFDLEFNRKINTDADGETMVDLLLSKVGTTFLDIYGLKYDPSWTVELDSSTEDKFSRHLVIRVPHLAFENNSHVGAFVGEICKRIHHSKDSNKDFSCLFVQAESRPAHHTELFVDQGVYSRNRSFRLAFSSKAGKTAKLMPTKRFRCGTMGEFEVFMDSLICRVEDKCERLLTFGQEEPGRGGTLDVAAWKDKPANPRQGLNFRLFGKSLFPALDIFIESVACIGNVPGRIRSWYWFSEYGVVVYNISENRFCENIGRPHKSNNVMYIVDFRTAGYYQKCHDPDCRGYRSSLRPIPRHTVPPEYPLSSAPRPSEQQAVESRLLFGEAFEDETWWEEVISSMSSLECGSQSKESQESHLVSQPYEIVEENDDDDWWCAVEQELVKLENNSIATGCRLDRSQSLHLGGGHH
ncbi:unnamed protein product [Calypogeia fissa]